MKARWTRWLLEWLEDEQRLRALTFILAGVVVIAAAGFAGYYYWDRYVHLGDVSPIERQIARLQEAIQQNPSDPEPRVALAEFYLGKQMYDEALEQALQVMEAYPDFDRAYLVAGVAYVRTKRCEEALSPLEQFIEMRKDLPTAKLDPALETAYYFAGYCYNQAGKNEEAIAALEAAINIEPTDADALYELGRAYLQAERYDEAVKTLHRAVRLVPDFNEAYAALEEAYTALGKEDYAQYARGMQAFSQGKFDAARKDLEAASQALPDFAPVFLGLGLTYEQLGMYDHALQAVQRALELEPNDLAARQALGRLQSILDAEARNQGG